MNLGVGTEPGVLGKQEARWSMYDDSTYLLLMIALTFYWVVSLFFSSTLWLCNITLANEVTEIIEMKSLFQCHMTIGSWPPGSSLLPDRQCVWSMWSVYPCCVSQTCLLFGKTCGLLLFISKWHGYLFSSNSVVVPASVSQVRWLLMPKNNRMTNFHSLFIFKCQ